MSPDRDHSGAARRGALPVDAEEGREAGGERSGTSGSLSQNGPEPEFGHRVAPRPDGAPTAEAESLGPGSDRLVPRARNDAPTPALPAFPAPAAGEASAEALLSVADEGHGASSAGLSESPTFGVDDGAESVAGVASGVGRSGPDGPPSAPNDVGTPAHGAAARRTPGVPLEIPQSLQPRVRLGWRLSGAVSLIVVGSGAVLAEFLLFAKKAWWPLPPGVVSALVVAALAFSAFAWPGLAWRRWSYTLRAQDLLLEYGVLFRTSRAIPRSRIQHVDVQSGPIDRLLGLATLTVYTAVSGHAAATIPGLLPEVAAALREELLSPGGGHGPG